MTANNPSYVPIQHPQHVQDAQVCITVTYVRRFTAQPYINADLGQS